MKKRFMFGQRGAISVFLVIILVPCLLVSSIFVDFGRVALSKAMVESSADLAMNTLLTNYDTDLNEWYGLVASCQNIDEFYSVSANSFVRMLRSQGLSEDEIFLLSDYFVDVLGDDTIHDLIRVSTDTSADSIVKAVDGADLTNGAVDRTEIVEFMKYRAPIEIAERLIKDLIEGNSTGLGNLIDAGPNEELIDAKTEYYETESELLKKAFRSYKQIEKYSNGEYNDGTKDPNGHLTNDRLQEYLDKMKVDREDYQKIHEAYVRYFANTSNIKSDGAYSHIQASEPTGYTSENNGYVTKEEIEHKETKTKKVWEWVEVWDPKTKKNKKVYKEVEKEYEEITYETKYFFTSTKYTSLITDLDNAIKNFEDKKQAVINAMSAYPYDESTVDSIQYWVLLDKNLAPNSGVLKQLKTAADTMMDKCARAKAAKTAEAKDDLPSGWSGNLSTRTGKIEAYQSKYLGSTLTDTSDTYINLMKAYEKVSSTGTNLDPSTAKVTVSFGTFTIEDIVKTISARQKNEKEVLNNHINVLKRAINGKSKVPSLNELKAKIKEYGKDLTAWSNEANTVGTDMGNIDQQCIAGTYVESGQTTLSGDNLDPTSKKIAEMGEAAVTALATRLQNCIEQILIVVNTIDSGIKYGGQNLTGIHSYSTFSSKANTKVSASNIPYKKAELDAYIESTFKDLFVPYSDSGEGIATLYTDDAHDAYLNPTETQPELYKYEYEQFHDKEGDAVDDAENEMDNAKDKAKEQEEAAKNQKANSSAKQIKPSYSPGNSGYSLGSSITSIIDLAKTLIGGDFESIRDYMYMTAYDMYMFSYDTYEYEGQYALLKKQKPDDFKDLKLSNYSTKYNLVLGAADQEKTWLSTNEKDSYNKSLTNKLVNSTNNPAFRCEVEYILYGKDTNDANVKAAYTDIYTLKYALNLISCFANFWGMGKTTGKAVNTAATALSGLTSGIVPAPAIKAVLLLLLTAAETCMDIKDLKAGFRSVIYKTADDWKISLPEGADFGALVSKITGAGDSEENKDEGFRYSDYITIFLMLAYMNSSLSEQVCKRTAAVCEFNMKENVLKEKGGSEYTFSKSKTYFQINAEMKCKPIMLELPLFNEFSSLLKGTDWYTYNISKKRGYM